MNSLFAKVRPARISESAQQLRDHLRTPLFWNAYLLIINQGLSAALGMLYWMTAARFYSTDFVGRGSAVISTLGFLEVLAEFSLKSAMQRFIPRAGMHVRRMVVVTYGVVLLTTCLFTVGFFVIGHLLHFADNLLAGLSFTALILLVLANMAYTIFVIQDGVLMGLRQTKWVLIENTLYNVIKMGLLVVGIFGFIGNGIVSSWFIPAPLLVLLVNTLIFTRFIPRFHEMEKAPVEAVTSRQIVRMVTGDHLGTVLSETSIRLLPLLVLNLLGTSANAFFYQAWLIGMMLYLLSWNVAASFSVEGSAAPQKLTHYSRQTLRQILFLIIPVTLVVFAGAPLILGIFGPAYARNGTTLLRWLALAAIPYGFNAWFLSYSRVRMDIRPVIIFQGIQCVITLGLSYWWLPLYGISAIGVAWLLAQTTISLLALWRTRRVLFVSGQTKTGQAAEGAPSAVVIQPAGAPSGDLIPQTGFSFLSPNLNDQQIPGGQGGVYLFLSPHLDDAVLSCGGLISRLTQSVEKVVVVSVFTADVPDGSPISWLAQRNLRAWGLEAVASPFALRRSEDTAATCRLGAESIHLGFLDALYRRSANGELYYSKHTVGVPLEPEDRETTGRAIEARLRELASQFQDETAGLSSLRVFVPLGVGGHVDHLLVRFCAEAVFDPAALLYYEEMPYAVHLGVQCASLESGNDGQIAGKWMPVRVALTPEEIETRIDAARCYVSQIPGLFPSPVRRNLEILSTRAPSFSRPLWQFYQQRFRQEQARERMACTMKSYIRRTGGENYWYVASPVTEATGKQGARIYGKK